VKPTEVVVLTEYVKQCCPQQAKNFGEYTADAWHDLLGDLRFADCRAAVTDIAKRQPFVAASEIRDRVREIRMDRLSITPVPPASPEVAADPAAYQEWLRTWRKRIADGDHVNPAIGGVAALEGGES
jgi:hypothetical protein